ncbi:MAG: hypothetical protein Q8K36_06400 [Alphaproteobacteria bacterium]|nr:hypothetical protein [Alphaproteobacteria bacterium]
MKTEQYSLFSGAKAPDDVPKTTAIPLKRRSAAYSLTLNLPLGHDKSALKNEGILILRMLMNRHEKACYGHGAQPAVKKGLLHYMAREMKIKKGLAAQDLMVMDALIQNEFQK